MALNDQQLKRCEIRGKDYKLSDGQGLQVLVKSNGRKYWRYAYRYNGKQKTLALGTYPDISIKAARVLRAEARQHLDNGIDPAHYKKVEKEQRLTVNENTFQALGNEWFAKQAPKWTASNQKKISSLLERNVYPWIGARPIKEITAPEVLSVLRRIESRGANETARRIKQISQRVFSYAIATGRAESNPAAAISAKDALAPVITKHHPSITDPKAIGQLLRAIDGYTGEYSTRSALQLAPLVFVRPGELRQAKWAEFDLDHAKWRIPAERMKMNTPHVVPLSQQAVAVLRDLQPLTGRWQYVFPSTRSHTRPMSDNTLNAALRRMGYSKDEMTAHGFRSIASTLLNEQGWNRDAIERQLAHQERDSVRAAYNYAEYLPERVKMMQAWSDYLDGLKHGATITPINSKRA